MKLFNFFKPSKSPNINQELYKIIEIESTDEIADKRIFSKISSGEIGGVIIKNVFDAKLIELLLNFHKNEPIRMRDANMKVYPPSFVPAMYRNSLPENYFLDNQTFVSEFVKKTNINLVDKIIGILTSIDNQVKVESKKHKNGGSFLQFQFRAIEGENLKQTIHGVHCEDAHLANAPDLNDALGKEKINDNILTWYIPLLKPSTSGGELNLYDLKWNRGDRVVKQNGKELAVLGGRNKSVDIDKIQRMSMNPNIGDMIFFNGGNTFHSVTPFSGITDRLTLGCFLNCVEENRYEIWG